MNSTRMFARVVPTLSPRARSALGGAPVEIVAELMGGHDVGLTHRVLEGLGELCAKTGAPLAVVVEASKLAGAGDVEGALRGFHLGGAYDDAANYAEQAKTAWMNSNSVLGKLKKAATKAEADPLLKQIIGYQQQAWSAAQKAGGAANLVTDPVEQGAAFGFAQQAQSWATQTDANVDAANAVVTKLPAGGGGGGPPPPKTCPPGQRLDANNNCVAETAPTTAKKSSIWPYLLGAGAVLGAIYVATEDGKKKRPRKAAA